MKYHTDILNEEFLTTKDVSSLLNITRQALYIWRKQHKGPKFINLKVHGKRGKILYPKKDFLAWLSNFEENY